MAQKTQVILIDDIDGGDADETVSFALDGVSYEIDLTTENAQELRDALAQWVASARKVGGRAAAGRRSAAPRRASADKPDLTAVRSWARENGYTVSDRGRISGEVLAAYEAAH